MEKANTTFNFKSDIYVLYATSTASQESFISMLCFHIYVILLCSGSFSRSSLYYILILIIKFVNCILATIRAVVCPLRYPRKKYQQLFL